MISIVFGFIFRLYTFLLETLVGFFFSIIMVYTQKVQFACTWYFEIFIVLCYLIRFLRLRNSTDIQGVDKKKVWVILIKKLVFKKQQTTHQTRFLCFLIYNSNINVLPNTGCPTVFWHILNSSRLKTVVDIEMRFGHTNILFFKVFFEMAGFIIYSAWKKL